MTSEETIIINKLIERGFSAVGKSGIYVKNIDKPAGKIKVNPAKKVLFFHDDVKNDDFEHNSDVPELDEIRSLFVGVEPVATKEVNVGKTMGQDLKERVEKSTKAPGAQQPAKDTALPATRQDTSLVPANESKALINNNKFDAVKVNDIAIPNEYIVLYAKKNMKGEVVGYAPYILEKGLEFLAGKMGLYVDPRSKDPTFPAEQLTPPIDAIPVKMPGTENEWGGKGDVVFKGFVRMANGQVFTDYGTATSKNLNQKQAKYPIEMAITRAKARALRDATHCNICSLEEADLDPKDGTIIDAEFSIVQSG